MESEVTGRIFCRVRLINVGALEGLGLEFHVEDNLKR